MPGEKLSDDWTHESPEITAAYKLCLEADEHLQRAQTVPLVGVKNAEGALVNIRVLGYLLVLGPTDTAREHVASMIVKAKDLTSLIDLGEHYEKRFLRPCKFASHHGLPYGSNPKTIQFAGTEAVLPMTRLTRDGSLTPRSPPLRARSSHAPLTTWKPGRV